MAVSCKCRDMLASPTSPHVASVCVFVCCTAVALAASGRAPRQWQRMEAFGKITNAFSYFYALRKRSCTHRFSIRHHLVHCAHFLSSLCRCTAVCDGLCCCVYEKQFSIIFTFDGIDDRMNEKYAIRMCTVLCSAVCQCVVHKNARIDGSQLLGGGRRRMQRPHSSQTKCWR